MPEQDQATLDQLTMQPWTIRVEQDEDGLVARVEEMPDAIATGPDETSLMQDLWDAIQTSLMARIDHGDPLPIPSLAGVILPKPLQRIRLKQSRQSAAWEVRPAAASSNTFLIGTPVGAG